MKRTILILFCTVLTLSVFAQQNLYKWRLGLHGGIGTYYGDLSTGRFLDPQTDYLKFWDNPENLSYGLSLEYSMNKVWSLRFMSTFGSFKGNSRATKWNGDPYTEDLESYSKALNFRTTYKDLDAIFIYSFDNGKLLSEKSFFAPYFGLGIGYMNFKVKGDLYNENGGRYYYWSDNTIRDLDENDPFAGNANIIEQDGDFETDLRALQTEGKDYGKNALTLPLALGMKFRLGDRFNLNLETLLHYSFNDYLDDVSGDYIYDYDSPEQAYAGNPSGILTKDRGAGNKMNDIYGLFNVSLGFNFGYKKQAFNAPIFYLGNDDPIKEDVRKNTKMETPAVIPSTTVVPPPVIPERPDIDIDQDYSDLYYVEEDTFEFYTEPVYIMNRDTVYIDKIDTIKNQTFIIDNVTVNQINVDTIVEGKTTIIRDTIYEQGTIIKEKVIIRTDTVREIFQEQKTIIRDTVIDNRSGGLIPLEMETADIVWEAAEVDTMVIFNPETREEETFFVLDDELVVESVPEEPIFTLEELESVEIEELDENYFDETIGFLEEDLSEEEVMLSEIQESNFELIVLRHEINELKSKENKSQEDIDAIYDKLDEISNEYRTYESYNHGLTVEASDAHMKPENQDIRYATNTMGQDLAEIRTEIIYLEPSNTETISKEEYEEIQKENEKRIEELEKEMRKLRKKVRKANRPDLVVNNPSRLNHVKKPRDKNKRPKTETVVIKHENPELDAYYKSQISSLETELERLRNAGTVSGAKKDAEIKGLKNKLADLERKINTVQTTGNTDSKTLDYITDLEKKMDMMNADLDRTKSELATIKNRPAPKPSTTTIIRTEPATVIAPTPPPAPIVRSQITYAPPTSYDAISRLGNVNVYFDTGKSNVKSEHFGQLDRVVNLMNQYPEIKARVSGFTDKSGNPQANLILSKKRSEAVASYLRTRGIPSSRISMDYQGEAQSASINDPFSRRVEIILNSY